MTLSQYFVRAVIPVILLPILWFWVSAVIRNATLSPRDKWTRTHVKILTLAITLITIAVILWVLRCTYLLAFG
jgi:hypothetical protein